jgi:pilus assembly protein TadC
MPYPVSVSVEPSLANRNRLTTAFRLILAIPHLILVGGLGFGFATQGDSRTTVGSETGLLGAVAIFLSIVSWFTIVFAGTHIAGIREFTSFYLRWRVRALAYFLLLEDAYPPFGDAPYPASIQLVDPAAPRDRLTVAFRLILAIPHFIVLFFVLLAWCVTTIAAWFAILFTGNYPRALYDFGVGALRWRMRVESYLLLMVDEYPPFSLT